MNTTKVTSEGYEVDELIIAGVEKVYPDKADQFRALLGAAALFQRHRERGIARALEHHVAHHRTECLEAGVCPLCGEEVTVEEHTEHHPAPFGSGTVPERRQVYRCGNGCDLE